MKHPIGFGLIAILFLFSCASDSPSPQPPEPVLGEGEQAPSLAIDDLPLIASLERAHQSEAWADGALLRLRFAIDVAGEPYFGGEWISDRRLDRIRLDLDQGVTVAFDGEAPWTSGAGTDLAEARSAMLLVSTLFLTPHVLRHREDGLRPENDRWFRGSLARTARLTFQGESPTDPDDWFLLFQEKEGGRLSALVVSLAAGSTTLLGAQPKIVIFDAFAEIEGLLLPESFRIYPWEEGKGAQGEALAEGRLGAVLFDESAPEDLFLAPSGAKRWTSPGITSETENP